jgi:hypothetical protein
MPWVTVVLEPPVQLDPVPPKVTVRIGVDPAMSDAASMLVSKVARIVRLATRFDATGVPHPVTGSQPGPAEYPLLEPEVMS